MPAEAGNAFEFSSLGLLLLAVHGLKVEVCLDDCVPALFNTSTALKMSQPRG